MIQRKHQVHWAMGSQKGLLEIQYPRLSNGLVIYIIGYFKMIVWDETKGNEWE